MKPQIKIFENAEQLALQLAREFKSAVHEAKQRKQFLTIALSGGSTPAILFKTLATADFKNSIPWKSVHFFWGDERCVPPDHPESNYGMTQSLLFDHIRMPEKNIHRIRGEADPTEEAIRYTNEIRNTRSLSKTIIPQFDWIMLGLGDDGHTASLFPGSPDLPERDKWCVAATHPQTGQKRISFTFPLINQAKRISFLLTGEKKADVVQKILNEGNQEKKLPASYVNPQNGILEWYLDRAAAALISI